MTETSYIIVGLLLLASVLASKVSSRLGVPALLLFLLVGMLAGSDGPGGIYFDDPGQAQTLGALALVLILFSGGLDAEWRSVRPVVAEGGLLSSLGVLVTAAVTGGLASCWLGLPLPTGLLLGSIVSSTDAAAVLMILRSKGVGLKGRLRPLLELESGSNDPMAVFLTAAMIQVVQHPDLPLGRLLVQLPVQMALGAALGYVMGRAIPIIVNRLSLGFDGLYPVLTLALVLFTYGTTVWVGGNGFLAVYIAGIVAGNRDFVHKWSLLRFHDGLAWLMQIAMFLTLGLLVFPSRLLPSAGIGLVVTFILVLVARPASVFLCLAPFRISWREKLLLSWVGLRGAVPIILATYPLLAGLAQGDLFFNVVFFVVLVSVLVQGTSISLVARWLRVDEALPMRTEYPLRYAPVDGFQSDLRELALGPGSPAIGRSIVQLQLPARVLVVLVARDGEFIVPNGGTVLQAGDSLLVLSEMADFAAAQAALGATQGVPESAA